MRSTDDGLRVGTVAARTGVTVRTLHHWDEIGLPLARIGAWLERPEHSFASDLELQIAQLDREIVRLEAAKQRLDGIARHLRATGRVSVADLLACMETMMNVERHFTPEQLQQIEQRAKDLGPEGMAASQQAWTALIAEVRAAMARGADPASDEAQGLARRWNELVEGFTGGDPAIAAGVKRVWQHEGAQLRERFGGPDPEMFQFIQAALGRVPR